ncbi:MAG: hypothetical protein ACRDYY_13605 [Acidimicrobiales bacterium]
MVQLMDRDGFVWGEARCRGVSARVVMEILGHSSFALTMDTYTHVMAPLMRDAADAMDRALQRS